MKSNSLADTYEPQLQKSMKTVLCSRFISEYGFMGGKEVIELIVNDLLKIVNEHQLPLSKVKKGQILWQAVAKDETSSYGKSMSDTRTIPVILTLVSDEDINMRINGTSITQIRKNVAERIMKEADEQGGTLSQPDIALLLAISRASVGKYIHEIQNEKGTTLPYRGTIHDMGPTVTHKRDIVRLKLQKMSTPEIARRTNHSEEAVDRYINDYERVTRISSIFEPIDIAFITNLSESLVIEYLDLKKEFQIGA
jgi:predicted transcriptional regulator